MKRLLLCVLLLAGCSVDTSATDERAPQLDYPFQVEQLGLLPATKFQQYYGNDESVQFHLYSTEEQIAFLKSNEAHLHGKLNDVEFDKVRVAIGTRTELDGVVLYEARLSISLTEYIASASELTSLTLAIQDQELLWTPFSRIQLLTEEKPFVVQGELADQDADHFVYTVRNGAYEDVEIKRLYVEGVNGVQIDFDGFPQVLPQKGELRLIQKTQDYNEQRIQGQLGIFAVFADNSEQFIGVHDYFLAAEEETMLQEIVSRVKSRQH